MQQTYEEFIRQKRAVRDDFSLPYAHKSDVLFGFQKQIVEWALGRGRACIFADCGMGKTLMQLEWARNVPGDVLILAPLAVAQQTVEEGKKIGVSVKYCRAMSDVEGGVTIANYEMLPHFDCSRFAGVVLDESSILKSFMGKTKRMLIEQFRDTQYKLACTATPAPNDHMEIGNHAEFVGVMSSSEMLAAWFINDPAHVGRYRLKGHGENAFWEWMSTWAVMVRKPSDLGFDDDGFVLPPIEKQWHVVAAHKPIEGFLFELPAASLQERIAARRNSVEERVAAAVELVAQSNEQWLVWCALNSESKAAARLIDGSVEVCGADTIEHKTNAMLRFAKGELRVLISKPSICGFGMNFQSCRNMVFIGMNDSWEAFYQAVRRCWRFGQKKEVKCHIITADTEGAVVQNILRKEHDASVMAEKLASKMKNLAIKRKSGTFTQTYNPTSKLIIPSFINTK